MSARACANSPARARACALLAHAEFLKENLVQVRVIILSGMHQQMFAVLVKLLNDQRQADDFGACAEDGHHFHKVDLFPVCMRSAIQAETIMDLSGRGKIYLAPTNTVIFSAG
jgi:hypothetical protein